MKTIVPFILLLMLAGCQQEAASPQYSQQEGIVRISVVTRGSYQFILQPNVNNPTKNYLVTNFTDVLKGYFFDGSTNIRELAVVFSGTTSPEKTTIYKPGPTDVPEPDYELPTIRLTAVRLK